MIRTSLKSAKRVGVLSSKRSIYTVPVLENLPNVASDGIKGLYSQEGFNKVWTSRAQHYVNNLNQTQDSELSVSHSLEHIISTFANEESKRSLFENASILLNTKFALECLAPIQNKSKFELPEKATLAELLSTPSLEATFPNEPLNEKLKSWLELSFGSINEFRTLLLNSAEAIKGDGFVWLVAEKLERKDVRYENLYVVNTYHCGQPNNATAEGLANLKFYHQKTLEQKQLENEAESVAAESLKYSKNSALFDTIEEARETFYSRNRRIFVPLLSIDASPKAYLYDYGAFGKTNYLNRVWECIDWDKIAARLPERSSQNYYVNE